MNDHHDDVQFLSASPHRLRLLRYLQESPCSPYDITEALELSRRGVQRNLSELTDRGWVEKTDGRYRLTTTGEFIILEYSDFLNVLKTIETCEPFYGHLPDCGHAPNPRWLTDAEIITADPAHPHAPIRHYMSSLCECSTETIRGLVPVLSQFHTGIYADLLDYGVEIELVLPQAAAESADSEYSTACEDVLHSTSCDVYVSEGSIGVGLTLTDRRGFMGAYDDQGRLRACVISTHPALLDWAERLYDQYRERSCSVTPDTIQLGITTQ